MAANRDDVDLYEVLGVEQSASKAEIKKAYHKAALSSHPDKVAEDLRADAEIKFKAVSQAYEILSDDDQRHLYDTHGISAFDGSRNGMGGMDAEINLDDLLGHMFGMKMGGSMPGMGGAAKGRPKRPKKGANVEQPYEVTLEELYTGKTTRFNSTKNVICTLCNGSGGKDKAKPKECDTCKGQGYTTVLRAVAPGYASPTTVPCSVCAGVGQFYRDKDRCKKCKGNRVNQTKKMLELYIARGAKQGDKIVLAGEADQVPDQEPGDIVFELTEAEHKTFQRSGPDLVAEISITLAEALSGINRVVLRHLDGRGICLNTTKDGTVLKPQQVLRISGEGMPIKRSDSKGALYLVIDVEFPEDGWLKDPAVSKQLKDILPQDGPIIDAEDIEEVDFEKDANLEEFGGADADQRTGALWEDEDEDDDNEGAPQCAQQ